MKYAWLVAWREYAENAKTKGFWLGLFLMPAILFFSAQVPIWLEEKATPTRSFVLADQSGIFASVIESSLERVYQQRILHSLNDYARKYSASQKRPATSPDPLAEFAESTPRPLDTSIAQAGKDFYLEQLHPRLKAGALPFKEPRRMFQRMALPAGLKELADLPGLAESLKPYLRGETKLKLAGQQMELGAAILIPRDITNHIVRPKVHASAGQNLQIQYWSANASDFGLRDE